MSTKLSFFFIAIILLFSLNAITGNGSIDEIKQSIKAGNPTFESSQARTRFVQTKSIVDDKTFNIDKYSEIGFPDLAYWAGHYFPTFLPGTSFLALPFYILGENLELGVLATNLMIPIAVLITAFLMYQTLRLMSFSKSVSLLCSFLMVFATGIYVYSTSFNAHPISALSITLALYAAVTRNLPLFGLGFGLGVFVDYPNLFNLLPLAVFLLANTSDRGQKGLLRGGIILLPALLFILPLLLYTKAAFGTFFTTITSHEIQGYVQNGQKIYEVAGDPGFYANSQVFYRHLEVNPLNLFPGLLALLLSPARGIFTYFPVLLLSFWGISGFLKKYPTLAKTTFASILLTLAVYSSYNVNYGGWAFGPRYLIGVTPLLILPLAFAIKKYFKNLYFLSFFLLSAIWSMMVSSLGALTSRNLPSPLDISPTTNQPWGWGFDNSFFRDFQLLTENHPSSFFFNQFLADRITSLEFYVVITGVIVGSFLLLLSFYSYSRGIRIIR